MDLITKDSDTTLVLFSSLDRVLENVEYVVMNYRPVLNGEHYLTGEEVCERLCISKRTLQDYRDTGLLGYVQLPGKIIYRESDIMDLLERFYQKWNLENMESCFIDVLLSWKIEILKYWNIAVLFSILFGWKPAITVSWKLCCWLYLRTI